MPRLEAPARPPLSAQIKDQRRVYARAVLRSLASTYRGHPPARIAQVLRQSLPPLGVRLTRAMTLQLANDVAAGRPVTLA